MKCFLHIGTEKTGTSTLQTFLHINRDVLQKQGFIYTESAGRINNNKLSVAAYHKKRRDEFTLQYGIISDEQMSEFQEKIIEDLRIEIKKKIEAKYDSTIIFSSEHFHSRLTKQEEIRRLKEILMNFGITEIKVIVYLRNPAEIANSLYSTSIKSGNICKAPPLPTDPYYSNLCSHKQTILKFQSVFGDETIIPKLYEKKELKDGSIIMDFMSLLNENQMDNYRFPENKNKSLSSLGLNLLRRINVHIPKFTDNKPNMIRRNIVSYFENHFSDDKYIMSEELIRLYDEKFKESNEWVRSHYFPDRPALFTTSLKKSTDQVNWSEVELDRIALLISHIWIDNQQKILKQERIIKGLNSSKLRRFISLLKKKIFK